MKGFLFALFAALGVLLAVSAISAQENNDNDSTGEPGTNILAGKGTFVISESPDPKKILAERSIDILKNSGDEFDREYAHMMIIHHEGGIAMAQTILGKSDDPAIDDLANRIIAQEGEELEFLNDFVDDLNESNATNETNATNRTEAVEEHLALNIVHELLHRETNEWLASLPADKAELAFLKEMKEHHAESIKLGQVAVGNAEDEELEEMSVEMVARQLGEVGEMVLIEMALVVEPSHEQEPFGYIVEQARQLASQDDSEDEDESESDVDETNTTNTNVTNTTNTTVNTTGVNVTDVNETNETNTSEE